MSGSSADLEPYTSISSINGSHHRTSTTTRAPPIRTTMPSFQHVNVRNPMGRAHLPHPRPTVSLDPRPVVIPILSSVIGFPILVFALICALRHRAIKLRRKDHLKKLQSGGRSVTLDLPPRDRISYFSGGSSPEASMREPTSDRLDTIRPTFDLPSGPGPTGILQTARKPQSNRNNNHVKFVTPAVTLEASHTMKVEVVLHQIAANAAESLVGAEVHCTEPQSESSHSSDSSKMARLETGVEIDSSSSESSR
ncbi:hypothetical protein JTE90_006035 [Oedothorax gibbosus]|uniref:Uncharacterized protein n=1 Tax=Oedothorax gibbosus TaxID=931172 RepID=A0AAV6V229_9ARAC|nr:hypothetical protein JTE90_006035 [Oedothorax gibbosus]